MEAEDYRGVLVFAEQRQKQIHKVSYELLNKAAELATKLESPVSSALMGPPSVKVEELLYRGADRVYYIKDKVFSQPDEFIYKENLVELIREIKPEIVLIGATDFGRSLAPRVAAALKTGLTADCTGLEIDEEGKLVQIRPAFSENILAHIKTDTYPQLATIRYKEFAEAARDPKRQGEIIEREPVIVENDPVKILKRVGERKANITEAEVVVAGGRGLKQPEDFKLLRRLAGYLGGTIGASRDIVDEGYISKEYQVGYSGNRVKPKVYIACGISGAPQHLAGMKEADVIIAINTDPSAPIFEVADYGIVGDLYDVIPRLIDKVK